MSFKGSGRTLSVGSGEQFAGLGDAVKASQPGDTIALKAGLYENDFAMIPHDLHIVGVGGKAHLHGSQWIDNDKGILDIENGADVILENLEISGASLSEGNGAGVRHHGGDLTVRDSYFHDNQNGILAGDNPSARVIVEHSEFADNGSGDGYTHAIYVNHIDSLTVTDSNFHDTHAGHHIKSRASSTDVENCRLVDGSSDSSYSIDMPNGGHGTIKNNYIEQGSHAGNPTLINYGGEGGEANGSDLWVENNSFVNHMDGNAYAVRNWTDATAHLVQNDFSQVQTIATGNYTQDGHSGTDWLIS